MVAAVTVVLAALTGGCSDGGDSSRSDDRPSAGRSDSPTEAPSPEPEPEPGDVDVIDSETCAEVRSGIEAFNLGEFDETVEHFEKALPLAQEQDDGSVPASQLVEAVRYYAELDAELYLEASRSSPEFAKYKAITLGQCMSGPAETTESPGVEI